MQSAKETDKWYTPPNIENLVTQVLGAIDLDPCADDGKHIAASHHYTASDNGLSQEWQGRVFMNPPYSCPGKWVAKLQSEIESGRVSEAISLIPAATDTNWLSPLLDSQPVCFWKGRIKFLDTSYQPKQSARQSHCLVYWGANCLRFKEIFDPHGVVKMPHGKWNPADFGDVDYKADGDQLTIFCDYGEPPEPDDYPSIPVYEQAWAEWEKKLTRANAVTGTYVIDQFESLGIIKDNLGFGFVVDWLGIGTVTNPPDGKDITYNWERDQERINTFSIAPRTPQTEITSTQEHKTMVDTAFQFSSTSAIASQIAQLQEQLNLLTATLKPRQECEQKAEELRREVAQHSSEMIERGIPQEDILRWGKAIYSAATGVELVESDNGALFTAAGIAAQNEIIAELKAELTTAQKLRDQALAEHQEAVAALEATTAQRDNLATQLDFEAKPADQVMLERLKFSEDSTISERIINVLKGQQNELSGNQIIESLGMDAKSGRGAYTELNRLSTKGVILCNPDPLDGRKKLYRLPLNENTQQITQHLTENIQHDTLTISVLETNTQQNTQHSIENTQQNTFAISVVDAFEGVANIDPGIEAQEFINV